MGKQLRLFKPSRSTSAKSTFGGTLLKGRRKGRRPLNFKRSHHFVLKAGSGVQLIRHRDTVTQVFEKYSSQFCIKIYSMAVHFDHIHLCLKIESREDYVKWIRSVTSRLVARIDGFRFTLRPWSRVVEWGRAFKRVQNYIATNKLEADFLAAAWDRFENWIKPFAGRSHHDVELQDNPLTSRQLQELAPSV